MSFDFDLGLGSNRASSRPLNEQKNNKQNNNPSPYTYSHSSTTTTTTTTRPTPTWQQPGKPSWTHQPAGPAHASSGIGSRSELGGPVSMVGDIKGKSWSAMPGPTSGSGPGGVGVIGIVNKNPNLFGDLVNSALGSGKSGSGNVPLKSAAPAKGVFSMGGVAEALPKGNVNSNNNSNSGNYGYGSGGGVGNSGNAGWGGGFTSVGGSGGGVSKGMGLGGASMKSGGGGGSIGGGGMGVGMGGGSKDPFGSLLDFSTKPTGGIGGSAGGKASAATSGTAKGGDFAFGDFQNASKPSAASGFGSTGGNSSSFPKVDSFGTASQTPVQPAGGDSFDMFFQSSGSSGGNANAGSGSGEAFSGGDDWGGFDSGIGGGGHDDGNTTELDGLPPPPSGVSGASAKTKGLDYYKQGQFADAIKWLSWAEIILEKAGEIDGMIEVLSSRASCYKEVGEYKKAVADCTKVLDHDEKSVAVLVQRALLYESMEKYKLGAEDLRTVMNLDPGNRVARSTIHRLIQMAG